MNIKRCAECEKVFANLATGSGSILCRFCVVDAEIAFPAVRQYIKEHNFSTIEQIATGSEISEALIKGLILEGRFDSSLIVGAEAMLANQRKHQALSMMQKERNPLLKSSTTLSDSTKSRRAESGGKSYGLGRS